MAQGTIDFREFDRTVGHTVLATLVSATDSINGAVAARGTLTAVVTDVDTTDSIGEVTWTFTIDDAVIDDLAAGQTLTQVYDVTIDDGNGGTATQTITITITGTNDRPVVSDVAIAAVEDGLSVMGNFVVTDADTTDTHTFTITSPPTEGSVVNNNDGTFTFDPGTDFQDLADGETRDVTFTYTATDDSGTANATSSTAAMVTVTVTGTTDVPGIDLATLTPTDGFAILGADTIDNSGASVDKPGYPSMEAGLRVARGIGGC